MIREHSLGAATGEMRATSTCDSDIEQTGKECVDTLGVLHAC